MKIDEETIELAAIVAQKISARLESRFAVMPTLTLDAAAEQLGISAEKMRQLCNEGKIPYIRMDRLYRIKPEDINAFLEKNYQPARKQEAQTK